MNPETDFSIRSFLGGYDKNFTYLVTCNRTGSQAIVDAAISLDKISMYLRNDPVAVMITHGHSDHTTHLKEYANRYPSISIIAHPDSNFNNQDY